MTFRQMPADGDLAWDPVLQDLLARASDDDSAPPVEDAWRQFRSHWRADFGVPGEQRPASRTYPRLLNRFGPIWLPTLLAS